MKIWKKYANICRIAIILLTVAFVFIYRRTSNKSLGNFFLYLDFLLMLIYPVALSVKKPLNPDDNSDRTGRKILTAVGLYIQALLIFFITDIIAVILSAMTGG